MNSATKTKIISFSVLGLLVCIVAVLFINAASKTGKKDQKRENTIQLRADSRRDITVETIMESNAGKSNFQRYDKPRQTAAAAPAKEYKPVLKEENHGPNSTATTSQTAAVEIEEARRQASRTMDRINSARENISSGDPQQDAPTEDRPAATGQKPVTAAAASGKPSALQQTTTATKPAGNGKTRTATVEDPEENGQEMEPESVIPRGNRFHSNKSINETGLYSIAVSGEQKVTNGGTLKFITLEDITLDDQGRTIIKKGTIIYGKVNLTQDRLNVAISSIMAGDRLYQCTKTVIDQDGLDGIYVPVNPANEVTKETGRSAANRVNIRTNTPIDLVNTGVDAISTGVKSAVNKSTQTKIVTVKSNYKLYLK